MTAPSNSLRLPHLALLALLGAGLAGCTSVGAVTDMTASAVGNAGSMFSSTPAGDPLPVDMFVASTRRNDRGASERDLSDGAAHFSLVTVSVPPNHRAGNIETPTFGRPNPEKHFTLVRSRRLGEPSMAQEVATHLSGRIGSNRDVLVFVHGFNTSLEEARFRLAQIVADGRFGGVPILFTWPAQDGLLAYASAKENATVSRDALTTLLNEISALPSVGRVHVLAHSMGAWLAMEALRESAIGSRSLLNGRLGNVMLAAPDIDVAVFRQQMARLPGANVSVFSSTSDRALNLSSRLVGERVRVGAINPTDAKDRAELDRLGVKVYDLSAFSDGWINHGAYASTPDVVRQIGAQIARPRAEDAREISVIDGGVSVDQRPRTPAIESQPLPPPPVAASAAAAQ
ncbi:alpha/beta fold hydrolase [Methylocella sp. CPCC 101449]|uniref:alpha/beta hydrolase n=1 Tax=Methylocella sp. CPCC 101449 TaxID=2987531 RepID=UPI00288F3013|nr:alpha/beta fold hydrolase [Methylocella sp. CPCC 101449]MDT2024190.1 alpha/beta fold hydrolase [Methylocella sp. CPCC 101449]